MITATVCTLTRTQRQLLAPARAYILNAMHADTIHCDRLSHGVPRSRLAYIVLCCVFTHRCTACAQVCTVSWHVNTHEDAYIEISLYYRHQAVSPWHHVDLRVKDWLDKAMRILNMLFMFVVLLALHCSSHVSVPLLQASSLPAPCVGLPLLIPTLLPLSFPLLSC